MTFPMAWQGLGTTTEKNWQGTWQMTKKNWQGTWQNIKIPDSVLYTNAHSNLEIELEDHQQQRRDHGVVLCYVLLTRGGPTRPKIFV